MKRTSAAALWQEEDARRAQGNRDTKQTSQGATKVVVAPDAILRALPPTVIAFLTTLGVEDDSDFAWTLKEGELEPELEALVISTDDIAAATKSWETARAASLGLTAAAGTASSTATSATRTTAAALTVASSRKIR